MLPREYPPNQPPAPLPTRPLGRVSGGRFSGGGIWYIDDEGDLQPASLPLDEVALGRRGVDAGDIRDEISGVELRLRGRSIHSLRAIVHKLSAGSSVDPMAEIDFAKPEAGELIEHIWRMIRRGAANSGVPVGSYLRDTFVPAFLPEGLPPAPREAPEAGDEGEAEHYD
jgi:hypothetical protein